MYSDRYFAPVVRCHKSQAIGFLGSAERFLFVAGLQIQRFWLYPDLQKVNFFTRCAVLTVTKTLTRTHALDIPRADNRNRAHSVVV